MKILKQKDNLKKVAKRIETEYSKNKSKIFIEKFVETGKNQKKEKKKKKKSDSEEEEDDEYKNSKDQFDIVVKYYSNSTVEAKKIMKEIVYGLADLRKSDLDEINFIDYKKEDSAEKGGE